jgi:hypothetical protein
MRLAKAKTPSGIGELSIRLDYEYSSQKGG